MRSVILHIFCWLVIAVFALGGKPDYGPPKNPVIDAMRNIAYNFEGDIRIQKLDSIYAEVLKLPNDSVNRFTIYKLCECYGYCTDVPRYISAANRTCTMAREANDTLLLAKGLDARATAYHFDVKLDSAYYNYNLAAQAYLRNNDEFNYAKMIHNIGSLQFTTGMIHESEKSMIQSLKIFSRFNNLRQLLESYWMMTVIMHKVKNFDVALQYHARIDALLQKPEDLYYDDDDRSNMLAANYNNLGYLYYMKKDYARAIINYNKALEQHNPDKNFSSMIYFNRAESKMKVNPKDWAGVTADLQRGYNQLDHSKTSLEMIEYRISSGNCYLDKGDTTTALWFLRRAYKESRHLKSNEDVLELLPLLASTDHKKGREYAREYFKLNDSITTLERSLGEKFSRIAFETETVRRQNRQLGRNTNYTLLLCVVLVLFTLGSYIIYRLRGSNKNLEFARMQETANEKIYTLLMQQQTSAECARVKERNRLAMDLHDGVMNRIFTTRFNLEGLGTNNRPQKESVIQELHDVQTEIRKLSHELKESFEPGNAVFATAINNYIAAEQKDATVVFDLYIDKFINWGSVPPETRVVLFRTIQEACANARNRRNLKTCNIAIMAQGTAIKLRIWDDGVGFLPDAKKPGTGIRNIIERITAIGGTITLNTGLGSGIVLDVLLQTKA